MTFTLNDLLLLVLTVTTVVMVVYLIRLASQMARTATEVEQFLRQFSYMRPQIERLLEEAEQELGDMRRLTQRVGAIADDVGTVAHHASRLATPVLAQISTGPLRYASAALTGARIGLQVLRKRQKRKKEDEEED